MTMEKAVIDADNICISHYLAIEIFLLLEGLKHKLLSISQICDAGFNIVLDENKCTENSIQQSKTAIAGQRTNNVYMLDLCTKEKQIIKCLASLNKNSWM